MNRTASRKRAQQMVERENANTVMGDKQGNGSSQDTPKDTLKNTLKDMPKDTPDTLDALPPNTHFLAHTEHNTPHKDVQSLAGKGRWEPPEWRTVLQHIEQMRARRDAPVDTMGAHCVAEPHADPKVPAYFLFLCIFFLLFIFPVFLRDVCIMNFHYEL